MHVIRALIWQSIYGPSTGEPVIIVDGGMVVGGAFGVAGGKPALIASRKILHILIFKSPSSITPKN